MNENMLEMYSKCFENGHPKYVYQNRLRAYKKIQSCMLIEDQFSSGVCWY